MPDTTSTETPRTATSTPLGVIRVGEPAFYQGSLPVRCIVEVLAMNVEGITVELPDGTKLRQVRPKSLRPVTRADYDRLFGDQQGES